MNKISTLLFLFILLFNSLVAQEAKTGTVSGKVFGTKEALPSAYIFLDGTSYATTTKEDGSFQLVDIPAGNYKLKIAFIGFQTLYKDISLKTSQQLRFDKIELKEDEKNLNEVEVKGEMRKGSENKAILLTKESKQIVTVVSSEGIKKLPDKNAADALKRVAGVSVQNNKGEGGYVSLRGTPNDWTSTLINGDRIPVADEENTSRSFEFEVLPADLIDYIFVTRTVTPDLEGDNIGGSINFILKNPVDKRTFKINVGGGVNFLAKKPIMSANVLWGDVSKNKKFSYVLNATYLGRYYGTDAIKLIYGNNFNHGINRFELKDYSGMRNTFGFNGGWDYQVNSKVKIGMKFMQGFMQDDKWQNKLAYTYTSGDNATLKPQFIHGILNRELYGGEINAEIKPNEKWKVNLKYASYYNRFSYGNFPYKKNDPRNGYFTVEYTATTPIGYTDVDPILTNGQAYDPSAPVDPNNKLWSSVKLLDLDNPYGRGDHYTNIKPKITTAYNDSTLEFLRAFSETNKTWEYDPGVLQLDAQYKIKSNIKFQFGYKGRYKMGSRNLSYHEWRIDRRGGRDTHSYILAEFATQANRYDQFLSEYGSPYKDEKLPYMTRNQLSNFVSDIEGRSKGSMQNFYMNEQNVDYRVWVGSSYSYSEIQNSFYAMVDATIKNVTLTGGIRLEHTYLNETALALDFSKTILDTVTSTYYNPTFKTYTKKGSLAVLPSLNMTWSITDKMNLKAAISRTFHRTNFQETKPGAALIKYNDFLKVVGNPDLKPAYSHNLDLIYEYYWGNKGMFSIGTYGKYIVDHIFMTVSSDTSQSIATDATSGFVTKSFRNSGTSWVWGVEADIKRRFDFLPRFLSGFGVSANVTYSLSRMKVPGRPNAQPMAEQTPLLYNVSLFYEKYGVNARIAMNYTGASLLELNLVSKPNGDGELLHKDTGFDTFLGEIYSLDFQISYDFLKHFSVFIEGNNLLDSAYKEYRGNPNRPIRVEYYKPRGQIGFKYEL